MFILLAAFTLSNLITAIVALLVVGFILYLIEKYLPLSAPIKLTIQFLVVLFLILWLLSMIGLWIPPGR